MLLVGAGEMSELAARHLIDQGAHPVYVANRTWSRAQDLARGFAGIAVRFEDFVADMGLVDIVITSTAAPEPLVRVAAVRQALHARRERPLFFIDIGVPRNVEAGVERPRQRVLLRHRRPARRGGSKFARAPAGGAPGARHRRARGGAFAARLAELEVVPTIVSLREKLEAIRRGELDRGAQSPARGRRGDPAGDGSAVAVDRQQGPARAHRQAARLVSRRAWRALRRARLGDFRPPGPGRRHDAGSPAGEAPHRHARQPARPRPVEPDRRAAPGPRRRGRAGADPDIGRSPRPSTPSRTLEARRCS